MQRRHIIRVAIAALVLAGVIALWLNKRAIDAADRARAQRETDVATAFAADPAIASADHDDLPASAPVVRPILPIEVTPAVPGARPQGWLDDAFSPPQRARTVAEARTFAIARTDHSLMYAAPGSLPEGVINAVTVTLYDRARHVAVCRKVFRRDWPAPPVTEDQLDAFRTAFWGDVATYLRGLPVAAT